ncbi:cytochrome P450 [Cupriavidus respiraculi]|uniref:Biotin biosynthesis cytochrome P450 n=1 Tax=Cupriavidus respiraculi TaxID=195930 RepID=A0ABM8WQ15_9BURK|nr:cytochrome P450 [Cupriavidus respiraculi]CAG9169532.1 Biotin biosynthesis cytochrome P450 [Cupriavidus respiraculi]
MTTDASIAPRACTAQPSRLPPADPIAAVVHADPYPYYRELAARRPFHRDDALGVWVAAGAAEVAAVLAHPDCAVRPASQPVPAALDGSAAGDLFARLIRMNDGARHAPMKAVVRGQMARIDLAVARRRAQDIAATLVFDASDVPGTVNRWMFALPVLTVAELTGLPLAGHAELAPRVAAFAAAMSPLATPADIGAGIAAARWLMQWTPVPAAGAGRTAGMLSALAAAAREVGVDTQTIAANAIGLLVQACEATAGLVGNTLLRLAREPGAGAGETGLAALVGRVLRDDPPIQNTRRFVAADAVVCGVPLARGDTVLVLLAAASHDDARRERAWTFGDGGHACPGDALAAVLAEATVAALLARGVAAGTLARGFRYRPSVNARIPHFL